MEGTMPTPKVSLEELAGMMGMGKAPLAMLTITLPLPSKVLHPNARPHWAVKAKATKARRELAYVTARQALGRNRPPGWKLAEVQTTWYLARANDRDNLVGFMKATLDGIADAGVVDNDRNFIPLPPVQITGKAAGKRRELVIVITERIDFEQIAKDHAAAVVRTDKMLKKARPR